MWSVYLRYKSWKWFSVLHFLGIASAMKTWKNFYFFILCSCFMARIVNFKSMDNLVAKRKTEPYLNLTMIPGVTPGNSWWGCATQFSKSWPYFRPKKCHFHTRFQTWYLKKLCHHIVRLERQQKRFLNNMIHFEWAYFSVILLIWNWNDKYVHMFQ